MFAKRILGLEVGSVNIKLLQCRQKGSHLIVEKSEMIPTPNGSTADGIILDVDKIVKVIKKRLIKNKYKAKNLVIVIKSSEIISRDIKMDKMPKRDLEAILELQYKDYFLFDISHYQVSYKIIGEVKGKEKTEYEILIVAAPDKLINPLIEVATRLKLKVKTISIGSDAITKLFDKDANLVEKPYKETQSMVIDMGANSTTVTVMSRGVGVLNKNIDFGLASIDNDIISKFGESQVKDIEKFKSKYGGIYRNGSVASDYSNYISSLLETQIEEELVPQIRRFLQFHYSRSKEKTIERVYIVGGGAFVHNLARYMTGLLGIPCLSGVDISPVHIEYDNEFKRNSGYYANILGLTSEI